MRQSALPVAVALMFMLEPTGLNAQANVASLAVRIDSQAASAATAGLATFRELVLKQKNFREMGFESAEELDRATLGQPLVSLMVRLDELGEYKLGTDPITLLHDAKQLMYPVLIDGRVRSSVTVTPNEKGWMATGFGSAGKASVAFKTRDMSARSAQLAPEAMALVEVRAMSLVFIGHLTSDVLVLTPLMDYPAFGLKAGAPVKAADVFVRLAPATRAYRDAPI
jgi:hypothetical protein